MRSQAASGKRWLAACAGIVLAEALTTITCVGQAGRSQVAVEDPGGLLGRARAPVCVGPIALTAREVRAAREHRLVAIDKQTPTLAAPVQIVAAPGAAGTCYVWWIMAPGDSGRRVYALKETPTATRLAVRAWVDPTSGEIDITDSGRRVLRYNYRTVEPGPAMSQVTEANRIYARARSDYIHPLYGLDGEVLTKDWPIDHPHHRGIYWAWPEVDYHGERGDLHALQRVFARPTGSCTLVSGPVFAQIEAENVWKWDDRTPIVLERATIRVFRASAKGRLIDLTVRMSAIGDTVEIARRETTHYGGLNLRMAAVQDQHITFHEDGPDTSPRMAWDDLYGTFAGSAGSSGLAVLQNADNPCYPGEGVQYPELNWFQPTFPASGTRYAITTDRPLTLRYRLWVRKGGPLPDAAFAEQWLAYRLRSAGP